MAASKINPSDYRYKFLLATLRGVGGGKTRMIEESRIRLGMLYPNWLPIAITFGHTTEVNDNDFAWKDANVIVAYAICSRILSSVYTISIEEARRRTDIVLKSVLQKHEYYEDSLEIDLMVGTMAHVAARVRQVKPSMDSFVLFIDESMKLIENIQFPQPFSDPYSTLRRTILGKEMGKILKSSLVMTSLSVSAFGITDSSRATRAVELASKLSVEHIVTKIWIPSFNGSSKRTSKRDKAILKMLAASVNSAPRLVEVMGRALRKEFENTWPVSGRGQSLTQSLGAVLEDYELMKKRSYPSVTFPVGKYLHALINSKHVVLDDTALEYVRSSTFTNCITRFPRRIYPDQAIVPESALSLLVAGTNFGQQINPNVFEAEIKSEFDQIWSELMQSPSPSMKGQPLEDAFQRVLRIRILSMHLKDDDKGQTTLHDLLAVDIKAVMFPIRGRPYSVAKVTKGLTTVEQDGVNRSVSEW
eukprot:CAMPEP_0201112350 /NCGR_PEP_ID=MMETSP0812-20130820/77193_1 /ASSEMBLY_ACC=CAM_ASM_000668 /TAXON_ID=98059 /ORGANISM="Dinobryon sp., Strain UTEXLB2267" /LENGTH=473 /DNA_ID=CAMNT_0047375675 /DNA_START=346 /DNA_END=1764 /DNA_ORIENTATION=+